MTTHLDDHGVGESDPGLETGQPKTVTILLIGKNPSRAMVMREGKIFPEGYPYSLAQEQEARQGQENGRG